VTHGDPVTEGAYVEQKGIPSPCVNPLLNEACQFREIQVARDQVGRRISNPDKGLVDFALRQTGRMKQGARRRPLEALFYSVASHIVLILFLEPACPEMTKTLNM
jgi:hypothetical protein